MWPSAATRTSPIRSCGGVDLTRNPAAPARSARSTYWSASKVVSTTTTGGLGELADPLDGGDPVHAGHPQVHQHHVGPAAQHRLDAGRAVVGLVHDLDVAGGAEDRAQVRADHRLVVHHDHPDHAAHTAGSAVGTYAGSVASRQNPPSGVRPARRVPCTSSMRCRRLAMPSPEPVAARPRAGGRPAAAGVA